MGIDLEHVWNLGAVGSDAESVTRSGYYKVERGTIVYTGHSKTWQGAIGLMYPSDHGYSTSSNDSVCDDEIVNWELYSNCYSNSWLYSNSTQQWTLTAMNDCEDGVIMVDKYGSVYPYYDSTNYFGAKPVLYLKSDVGIVGGLGTNQQPFILGT